MSKWIKYFYGSVEEGTDEAIEEGTASWSRGRLDGMTGCWLYGFMCGVFIGISDTNWHQFDRFEVPLLYGKHKGRRIIRVIQAEIKEEHVGGFFDHAVEGRFRERQLFRFLKQPSVDKPSIIIEEEHIGKWFTVSIDLKGNVRFCFTEQGKYK